MFFLNPFITSQLLLDDLHEPEVVDRQLVAEGRGRLVVSERSGNRPGRLQAHRPSRHILPNDPTNHPSNFFLIVNKFNDKVFF